jgi:hypothetical protein
MQNVVVELERRFLPLLDRARQQLALEYPAYSFEIWSSATGSETSYKGYDIGIECILPDAKDHEANCVSASVGVHHITTAPELCNLGVDWCAGEHPNVSATFLDHPLPFTAAALDAAERDVPRLIAALRQALDAWTARGNAN